MVAKATGKRKTKATGKRPQATVVTKQVLPDTQWVLVTPKIAAEWLNVNIGNRRERPKDTEKYADDMRNQQWWMTHQGIAFDEEGNLIDGQHRLQAQILAGVTLWWLVTRGLPHRASAVVDTGIIRDPLDSSGFLGKELTGPMISIARSLREGFRQPTAKLSNLALIDITENHSDAILVAIECLYPKQRGVTKVAVLAAFARACYHIEEHVLRRLGYVLRTGTPQDPSFSPGEKTMITLRHWLITRGIECLGRGGRQEVYSKTSRALVAASSGQDLTKVYAATKELFPLPEENLLAQLDSRATG